MPEAEHNFREETTGMDQKFAGRVFQVEVHQVRLPDGRLASREIVRHSGGACVVALDDQEHVYLVRQFRKPYDTDCWSCLQANWNQEKIRWPVPPEN